MTIYEKADELLHKFGLLNLIQKYGSTSVVGSYRTKLMVWNDLDFYIDKSDFHSSKYYDLVGNILKETVPTRFDGIVDMDKNAIFFGFETSISGERWNVDIWWKNPEEIEASLLYENQLIQLMAEKQECGQAVLKIKQDLLERNLYGFDKQKSHYHSHEIYDAVFLNGVLMPEQFLKWSQRYPAL